MPIVVSTKDCTALSDAELVEMADLCAERPPGFDIGFLSKEREGVGADHPGPGGEQAAGLLVLHPGAHRGHALAAGRAGPGRPHRHGPRRPSRGSWPTSTAGPCWPSPTRTSCSGPGCWRPRASGPSPACRTSCPSRATSPRARSGPGPAACPSASAARAGSTTAPSSLKGDGSVAGGLDFFAPKVKIPEGVETHFDELQGRQGRPTGGLRLGHGRGPGRGQARPLSASGRLLRSPSCRSR